MSELLKGLFDKLERYELMNVIVPGIFFVVFMRLSGIGSTHLAGVISILSIALVSGMIASRIGATLVEWLIKKIEPFAPYTEYVDWKSTNPDKAAQLMTNLNMYRSLTGASVLLLIVLGGRFVLRLASSLIGLQCSLHMFYVLGGCVGAIALSFVV